VVIDQFGIAEHDWRLVKECFDFLGMSSDLTHELLPGVEEAKRMVICFRQEFNASCFCKLLKGCNDIRAESFHLFERGSGDGVSNSKAALVAADEFQHQPVRRQVAFVGHAVQNRAVGSVAKIIMVVTDLEAAIRFQPPRLVYLEVEAN